MSNYIEIEVRLFFEDDSSIVNWLLKNAAKKATFYQVDTYYQPKYSPFLSEINSETKKSDRWLRVREEKDNIILCYKFQHRNASTGDSTYADEIEVNVSSKEGVDKILTCLDFEEIAIVKKKRTAWISGEFEVDIDEVDGLGKFYEIEFHGNLENPMQGRDFIFDFLSKIGVSGWQIIDRAYPVMMINKENFSGI